MRRIAGEDHPLVPEALHAAALELVDRDPLESEIGVPEHPRDPRPDVFRLPLDGGIGVRAKLQVDAPDVVGLAVQQRRLPVVERRIEPEPALGRHVLRLHLHIGDQELVLELLAAKIRADHAAQAGPRAVAGDHIVRAHSVVAVGCLDREFGVVIVLPQRDHLVAPAQVDVRQLLHPVDQKGFGVILLQIDEGRHLVAGFGQQVELVQQAFAAKDLADLPDHALVEHAVGDAEPVP